jgi:hypothetical protein
VRSLDWVCPSIRVVRRRRRTVTSGMPLAALPGTGESVASAAPWGIREADQAMRGRWLARSAFGGRSGRPRSGAGPGR